MEVAPAGKSKVLKYFKTWAGRRARAMATFTRSIINWTKSGRFARRMKPPTSTPGFQVLACFGAASPSSLPQTQAFRSPAPLDERQCLSVSDAWLSHASRETTKAKSLLHQSVLLTQPQIFGAVEVHDSYNATRYCCIHEAKEWGLRLRTLSFICNLSLARSSSFKLTQQREKKNCGQVIL